MAGQRVVVGGAEHGHAAGAGNDDAAAVEHAGGVVEGEEAVVARELVLEGGQGGLLLDGGLVVVHDAHDLGAEAVLVLQGEQVWQVVQGLVVVDGRDVGPRRVAAERVRYVVQDAGPVLDDAGELEHLLV